jgi:hypothetical protein
MSLTIHDLRVSLRDKLKLIEELEKKLKELKDEINNKNLIINENEQNIRKKDDIITMKDLIIKEKDNHILKLEDQLINLNQSNELISNNVYNASKSTNSKNLTNVNNKTSVNFRPYTVNASNNNQEPLNKESSLQYTLKSKRIAISAESASNRYNKVKESIANLKEYPKSNE